MNYDVGFILDVSGSVCGCDYNHRCNDSMISECDDWNAEKHFTTTIAAMLNVTVNGNRDRASVLTFSIEPKLEIKFSDNTTKEAFEGAVNNLTFTGAGTDLLRALDVALKDMFNSRNGMRPRTSKKVAVLITDGKDTAKRDNKEYEEMVARFKQRDIMMIAVGVGSNISTEQLQILAPHDYFHVEKFDNLTDEFAGTVVKDVCHGKYLSDKKATFNLKFL